MILRFARSLGRVILRLSFATLLVMLVLLALYVSLGRQLAPMVSNYRAEIEQRLSESLGARVQIGHIEGEWQRFSPQFLITDLVVQGIAADGQTLPAALQLDQVSVAADIPASLLARQLVLASTNLDQLQLRFVQNPGGRWSLDGIGSGALPLPDPQLIFRWLSGLARFTLSRAELSFQPIDGEPLLLEDTNVQFQSQGGRHALVVRAHPDLASDELVLRAELNGSTLSALTGNVYLNAPPAEYAGILSSLNLTGQSAERLGLESLQLYGEFWLGMREGQLSSLTWQGGGQTELQVLDTGDAAVIEQVLIDDLVVDWLSLEHSAESGSWALQAEGLGFAYDGGQWPAGGLSLAYLPGDNARLHMDAVDVGLAGRLLRALMPQGELRNELDAFNARGHFHNLVLSTTIEEGMLATGQLLSNINDASLSAHRGAPAFWGVDGYVEVDFDLTRGSVEGFVDVDAHDVMMQLPNLFDAPWAYDSANGRVRFSAVQGDELQMKMVSSVIVVESDIISARGQFSLDVETGPDRFMNLELMIGALQADIQHKSQYLPMAPRAPQSAQGVLRWVDDAVIGGQGAGSGLVFRGRVHAGAAPVERTLQMFYRVDDGELKFDPQWPALQSVNGFVTINDGAVDVLAEAGQSLGIDFNKTVASVRPHPQGGSWLTVSGTGQGSAGQGLAYLQQTPVTRDVAQSLAGWEARGEAEFTLSLSVPLYIEGAVPDVRLDMRFADNELTIPEYALDATQLSGQLRYSAIDGLSSENISANVLGNPASIEIKSVPATQGGVGTQVTVSGNTSIDQLRGWSALPALVQSVLTRAEGEFAYDVTLLPGAMSVLQVDSDLVGVTLDYPAPFAKSADSEQPLMVELTFGGESTALRATLDRQLQMNLAVDSLSDAYSGLVYLGTPGDGMRVRRLNPTAPGIEVLGSVDQIDLELWAEVISDIQARTPGSAMTAGMESLTGTAGVSVGRLLAFDEQFDNVNVTVQKSVSNWTIGLLSESVSGELEIPLQSDQPWRMDLDHLHLDVSLSDDADLIASAADPTLEEVLLDLQDLPTVEYELPREDPLAGLDPRTFPYIALKVDELTLAGADYGSWDFLVKSDAAGALFSDLQVNLRGLNIGNEEEPAEFRWVYDGQQHRSVLNGLVSAADLAPVLSAFGYAPSIESRAARFDARLHWDGSPAYFSALGLNGDIDVQVNNGRFRQRAGVANSALRLISFINFDALVRRLRFSDDLARAGLSYDEIRGSVNLSQGLVTIEDRLQIIGPASLFQLAGVVNLAEETIDGDLYITLPVSDNIPWLGGLAVLNNLINWQLAVGVFIFDRIFGEQVDNLTSAHYILEGPWEGLEPRLYQVFADAGGN
tara:strand:- start:20413 stop:24477 length:4065 start_codon:yes stop_codon:yes gene_type:complete